MFAQSSFEYLGHVISIEGVAANLSKARAMVHWKEPKNMQEVHEFLGLTGYYCSFVRAMGCWLDC